MIHLWGFPKNFLKITLSFQQDKIDDFFEWKLLYVMCKTDIELILKSSYLGGLQLRVLLECGYYSRAGIIII